MEEADRDGDGYIGFEDFYRIMKKRGDDPLEDWSDDEEEQQIDIKNKIILI